MALLIDIGHGGWIPAEDVRARVLAHAPGADVRVRTDPGALEQITMLAVSRLDADWPGKLANLKLVQKLGAGVETIVAHPALPPHVRVARLKPVAPAREIAEYVLAHILSAQRHLPHYRAEQAARRWSPVEPRLAAETEVAVLGLGHIGACAAQVLRDAGFRVTGWARSPKRIDGVACRHGAEALPELLEMADYICAILPSTVATRELFGADLLARMKPGSTLLNAGRGDLIDQAALVAALDAGRPGAAVLDVTTPEPLPQDSPLWTHPAVTITPHVSGWHLGEDAFADVAENYLRLQSGAPLLHEVDRVRGY